MVRRGRPPRAPGADSEASEPLSKEAELALAAKVARAYFLDDQSKVHIANDLEISRFQVARLLTLARSAGLVRIEVVDPAGLNVELAEELRAALNLRNVVVVSPAPGNTVKAIGSALARLLESLLRPGNTVGLTWSQALLAMAEQVEHLQPCTWIQLSGHLARAVSGSGNVELVRRVAEISHGEAFVLYAPLVVPDARTAQSLRLQPDIAAVLHQYKRLDVAVVSVGAWRAGGSLVFDSLSPELQALATDSGVIGEISGRLFGKDGNIIPNVIDDRVIGIDLDQLRAVPEIVATSFGTNRASQTIVAAREGLFTSLVADESLALAILNQV